MNPSDPQLDARPEEPEGKRAARDDDCHRDQEKPYFARQAHVL
jgi:hypothetical protein